jgi:HlyD family secretion protein
MMAIVRPFVVALALAVAACSRGGSTGTLVARGTVEGREVTIRTEAGGRVVAAAFEEGDAVDGGAELVRLDRGELEARSLGAEASRDAVRAKLDLLRDGARPQETSQAKSAIEKARAELKRAEDERANSEQLARIGSVPQDRLREADTRARVARAEATAAEQRLSVLVEGPRAHEVQALEANLREAEAQVRLIGVQLDRTVIRAPFAGTVTRKSVELGEVVTSGTAVCTVTDLRDLKVKVYLPERHLSAVNINQPVEIAVDGAGVREATGRVRSIASTAEFLPKNVETADDRAFQVFAVRVAVDAPAADIKPGMNVSVRFTPEHGTP